MDKNAWILLLFSLNIQILDVHIKIMMIFQFSFHILMLWRIVFDYFLLFIEDNVEAD